MRQQLNQQEQQKLLPPKFPVKYFGEDNKMQWADTEWEYISLVPRPRTQGLGARLGKY